jgi:hypothetical protein
MQDTSYPDHVRPQRLICNDVLGKKRSECRKLNSLKDLVGAHRFELWTLSL